MKTKRQAAEKTAMKRATRRTAQKRRITFTVDGERYANLEQVAQAMNKTSWCNGNTPESVFEEFVIPWAENFLDSPYELCDTILSGIATNDENTGDAPEPMHTARIEELCEAFGDLHKFPSLV